MKKIFTILLVGIACLALSSCGANKNDGESVKKGNGSKWYFEPTNTADNQFAIIHSTFECPSIENGAIPNARYSDKDDKFRHTFCTKCMDEELIEKWYEWFEEKVKKDK